MERSLERGLEREDVRRGRAAVVMLVIAIFVATALAIALVMGAVADGSGSAGLGSSPVVSIVAILAAPLGPIG